MNIGNQSDNVARLPEAKISGNTQLRTPQIEFADALKGWYSQPTAHAREVSVVLPTGGGKTGCMAIAKFALNAKRALVVLPWVHISSQVNTQLATQGENNFYLKCDILPSEWLPKVVHWTAGEVADMGAMEEAQIVVTNIHQLISKKTGLTRIPRDFFDLILIDESHHNTANSWKRCREHFNTAKIVNFSATPQRADGKIMHGEIIYAYSIADSVLNGYCKSLVSHVIQPISMKVSRNGNQQVDDLVDRQFEDLGSISAGFRKAVNTEAETVQSIIQASLDILRQKRKATDEPRLKVIASARNIEHCKHIAREYEKHGVRTACLHSQMTPEEKAETFNRIENHKLDVVVQVRMLSEGFDHVFFNVAAIFSSFGSLLRFYQFVGRTMRCIKEGEPGHPLNEATIVIHGATNQVKLWEELKALIDAGKEYYNGLVAKVPQSTRDMSEVNRRPNGQGDIFQIIAQQLGIAQTDQLVSFEKMFNRLIAPLAKQNMSKEQIGSIVTSALSRYFAENN